jgi:hypothetical protein
MDGRRTGGAGILQARGGFEAQLRRVFRTSEEGNPVQETGIEGAEVYRVDVFRLQPGVFDGGLGDLADQHFRIDAVELPNCEWFQPVMQGEDAETVMGLSLCP